jgi:hypothetical protein
MKHLQCWYAKMNLHLLDIGGTDSTGDIPMFESLLEFVDSVIEEEAVEKLADVHGGEGVQVCDAVESSDDHDSDISDAGGADDW